jgi:hypothetical protein
MSTGNGFCNVTALLAVTEESAELMARTVTMLELGTTFGAVYKPDELIRPAAALPPATPFTCQVAEVLADPATVALKDCVVPARTFACAGTTVTVTFEPEGGVLEFEGEELFVVPVQPPSAAAASRNTRGSEYRETNSFHLSIRKHTERAPNMRLD